MHFFCQKPPETRLLYEILNIKRQSASLEEAIAVIGHQVTFTAPGTGHVVDNEPHVAAAEAHDPADQEVAPARKMRSNHASPQASMKIKVRRTSSLRLAQRDANDAASAAEDEARAKKAEEDNGEGAEEGEVVPGRSRGGFRDTGSVKAAKSSQPSQPLQSGETEGKFRGSVKARRGSTDPPRANAASSGGNGKESGGGPVGPSLPGALDRNQSWSIVKLLTNPFKHMAKGNR